MGPSSKPAADADQSKRRKRKVPATLHFAGLKCGNWVYPPADAPSTEEGDGCKGSFEIRISFSAAAGGKMAYEFPFHSQAHPEANRALIEFPLASINAMETDDEGAFATFLLAAPPLTFIGQQSSTYSEESMETVWTTQFEAAQVDFSMGPVKTCRSHTLYLGAGDMLSAGGMGRAGGRGGRAGGKAGRAAAAGVGATVRRLVAALSQDEVLADIIEQERQAEPGGHFPAHEIIASMRQTMPAAGEGQGKGGKPRRRSAVADSGDGPVKRRRAPKAARGVASRDHDAGEGDEGGDAGQDDEGDMDPGPGPAPAQLPTLELGLKHPSLQQYAGVLGSLQPTDALSLSHALQAQHHGFEAGLARGEDGMNAGQCLDLGGKADG